MVSEATINERKQWKKRAKTIVKRHYVMFVILCLVAIFYGTEFNYVVTHADDTYRFISSITLGADDNPLMGVAKEMLAGVDEDAVEKVEELQEAGNEISSDIKGSANEKLTAIVGGNRGAMSSVVDMFSSGRLLYMIFNVTKSIAHSSDIIIIVLIIISALISVFLWVFLKNVYAAILRRMFLEARLYENVPFSHVLHFKIYGRWIRASLTMLLKTVFLTLWWLTLVGGVIKMFSYRQVPYIVAENPDISPKEAITLSRRIMDGHKMEAFKIELSYIGWHILGFCTLGFAEALWVLPYKTATYAEYYAYVRTCAKENGVEGVELLNDDCLFAKAGRNVLEKTYADIEKHKEFIDANRVTLAPVKAFFAKNCGLWIGSEVGKAQYDEVDNVRQQIVAERAAIRGELYPQRLNPLWKEEDNRAVKDARFIRTYTVWAVVLFFFIFSFVGWAWEVSIHLVEDGVFINRGVMHGPWLPVYGGGVSLILVALARWRRSPLKEAVLIILLCGFVEFMTSYYLEVTKGMRWWDYTGYFLNLDGRICCEGLMVFAVGGMAAVYFLTPFLDSLLSKLPTKLLATASIVLVLAFVADVIYSHYVPNIGEGITDYDEYKGSSTLLLSDSRPNP
ncbi:MAG: DUF975 family protein [Firmicutes bacterium]|nr:DUF975 family protein [Bacillota bacterium]